MEPKSLKTEIQDSDIGGPSADSAHPEFRFETREQVVQFEQLLESYQAARTQCPLHHVRLTLAWDWFGARSDHSKLFAALLDLWLCFLLLHLDSCAFGGTWNDLFSKGKLEGGSILDSPAKFFGKLDIHRHSTAYALRYRAFWDKCMGFLVLLYAPHEYESFYRAARRRRFFGRLFRDRGHIDPKLVEAIDKNVAEFDDRFRTPEAHGPGVLRKWTLSMATGDTPLLRMHMFWNLANHMMISIGNLFGPQRVDSPNQAQK